MIELQYFTRQRANTECMEKERKKQPFQNYTLNGTSDVKPTQDTHRQFEIQYRF